MSDLRRCNFCSRKFFSKIGFKAHQLNEHGQEPLPDSDSQPGFEPNAAATVKSVEISDNAAAITTTININKSNNNSNNVFTDNNTINNSDGTNRISTTTTNNNTINVNGANNAPNDNKTELNSRTVRLDGPLREPEDGQLVRDVIKQPPSLSRVDGNLSNGDSVGQDEAGVEPLATRKRSVSAALDAAEDQARLEPHRKQSKSEDNGEDASLLTHQPEQPTAQNDTKAEIEDLKKFRCGFCEKEYSFTQGLRRHVLSAHTGLVKKEDCRAAVAAKTEEAQIFSCQFCKKTFTAKINLQRHTKLAHRSLVSKDNCDLRNSSIHTMTDAGSTLQVLDKSGVKNELKAEAIESQGFSCHICTKNFTFKGNMKRHVKLAHRELVLAERSGTAVAENGNEEPSHQEHFEPDEVKSSSPLSHDRQATPDTSGSLYHCNICRQGFNLYRWLFLHMKTTHSDALVVDCKFCSLKFASEERLEIHLEAVHRESNPFHCNLCNFKVADEFVFSCHRQRCTSSNGGSQAPPEAHKEMNPSQANLGTIEA